MWQKGPGEGFHAAKADALAIEPTLRCISVLGVDGRVFGYLVVWPDGRKVADGAKLARDAWGNAFFALGGKYKGGEAILPK